MTLLMDAKAFQNEIDRDVMDSLGLFYSCLKNDNKLEEVMGFTHKDFLQLIKSNLNAVRRFNNKNNRFDHLEYIKGKVSNYVDEIIRQYGENFSVEDYLLYLYDARDSFVETFLELEDIDFRDNLEIYLEQVLLRRRLLNNDFIINLNQKVKDKNIHIFDIEEEVKELSNNLFKVRKPNVLIIGKAGCGKSALVEGLAERINRGNVPSFLKNKIILELNVGNAVAGTRYRGEFEERIKNILTAVEKLDNVILFIDEIHTVMTAGGAEGAVAFGDILKPYLARGTISLIGATTDEEYKKIAADKAMKRRFTIMEMQSITREKIRNILKGWAPQFESHYHVAIDDEVISNIIWDCRKNKDKNSPDRELDALEEWCLENCNWRMVNWKND